MFDFPEPENKKIDNKVTITTLNTGNENAVGWVINKLYDYKKAMSNTYHLAREYGAGKDPNAFHKFLQDEYAKIPKNKLKVLTLPVLAPSSTQICQRVLAIGNPVILAALRQIPREETVNPSYYEKHPNVPKIGGGRAFDSVLEAIGMGVLSTEDKIHSPFTQQMIATLTIKSIDNNENQFADNAAKKWFVSVVKQETEQLMMLIKRAATRNERLALDFRFYALKIFLRGFYPDTSWDDSWIQTLSQTIEEVSDLAFKCMMDPYANLENLRQEAKKRLDPYINKIMEQDQSFYLSKEYVDKTDKEILKQIIISLLFAGGDNINKFLGHAFVVFGSEQIRNTYLREKPNNETLETLIAEVGRLYTTIHAQPGKALEDFVIQYRGEKIYIKAGDELHYTTWQANTDEMEWGPYANEFNPDENKKHYKALNPLATFGSGSRVCRGKSITLAIINYFVSKVLDEFQWEAYVDGQKNYHPTELNFNNGVAGKIECIFYPKKELAFSSKKASSKQELLPNWRLDSERSKGSAAQVGIFGNNYPAEIKNPTLERTQTELVTDSSSSYL